MKTLIQIKAVRNVSRILIAPLLLCFSLLPKTQAVSPPPDGGYPGGNTAEGQNALLSLTTGGYNTAVGFLSLTSNTTGGLNTAIGAGTLLANTAVENTATGAGALFRNTSGAANTANGAFALFSNTISKANTANGAFALFGNTTGSFNTANGADGLLHNTTGVGNTATGTESLGNNTTGQDNTANGVNALLSNTIGSDNVALGSFAGGNQTSGSNNVYVGAGVPGVAGESNACYIASIFGQTSANGIPVLINSSNRLGTTTSSKRFKQDIEPMDKASEALLALKPVTFCYKKEIDPTGIAQFGLVAEDVEKVNPDLVVRDAEGKPYSVRYDQVNAMLLNEFLKEHRTVQEQGAIIGRQQKQIEALTAGLQKVSAQVEMSRLAPQMVVNTQ